MDLSYDLIKVLAFLQRLGFSRVCKERWKFSAACGLVTPTMGLAKLNFDGSCVRDKDKAGFGGVIRDPSGLSLVSFAGSLPECSAIEAESFALWRGMQETR